MTHLGLRRWLALCILAGFVTTGCGDGLPITSPASPLVRVGTPPVGPTPSIAALAELPPLAIRPTPLAVGGFSGFTGSFPVPLDLVPDCSAEYSGPLVNASHSCGIIGVSARGRVTADLRTGSLGSEGGVATGGNSEFGGLHLAPGEVVIFGAVARVDYTLSITPLVTHVAAASVVAWATIDGTLRTVFGQWDGPSLFGVTTGSRALLQFQSASAADPPVVSLGSLEIRHDDFQTFGGVTLTNPASYSRFLNINDGGAAIRNGLVRSQSFAWSPDLLFAVALSTADFYLNQTAFNLRYWGATDGLDFLNTVGLRSLQVFDAAGNDISPFVAATFDNEQNIATGAPLNARDALGQLLASVATVALHPVSTPLSVQLNNALNALLKGNPGAACASLIAFVNLLQAQPKSIPSEVANAWLAQAALVRTILEC